MEDLNKNQLILLALLVSFVTSIATGIATVSLLERAPVEVTRVINRVVERTVETVVPQETGIVTKEETIVVREDDLITDSIATNTNTRVALFTTEGDFVGLGIVVADEGRIIAPSAIVTAATMNVRTVDGTEYVAERLSQPSESGVGVLQISNTEEVSLVPVVFPDLGTLRLGQSIIALSGGETAEVSLGVISRLETQENESGERTGIILFATSLPAASLTSGAMIFNVFGEVVAIYTDTGYIPFTDITQTLTQLEEE